MPPRYADDEDAVDEDDGYAAAPARVSSRVRSGPAPNNTGRLTRVRNTAPKQRESQQHSQHSQHSQHGQHGQQLMSPRSGRLIDLDDEGEVPSGPP